jgi:hypothetical protein
MRVNNPDCSPVAILGRYETGNTMKRMFLLGGMVFVFGFAALIFVQDKHKKHKKEINMNEKQNIKVVLAAFDALERRNDQRFNELLHPNFEIRWPPSLPYGRTSGGLNPRGPTWSETWIPLQPT